MAPAPTLYGRGHQPRESGDQPLQLLRAGDLFLDYVNTTSDHIELPAEDDFSPGYINIVDWCRYAGVIDEGEAARLRRAAAKEPREAAAVRKRACALREALYDIVLSLTSGGKPSTAALDLFNAEHRQALDHGRFVPGAMSLEWHWQNGADLDRMLWPVCQSAAALLGSNRLDKVRQCAAPSCQAFFLDRSKNGSRQFCSAAGCGTATRVRRFRLRRQPDT